MAEKQIIVIVGPSGSGKTTIGKVLAKNGIPPLITSTTRKPRAGEKDGVDYYFREFTQSDSEEFVEQTIYNGNRYGLTKAEVTTMLEKYDTVHVSMDRNGAEAMTKAYPNETCIVFVTISEAEMMARMERRGDSKKEIKERIAFSRKTNELTPPELTDLVVVNHHVQKAAEKIIDHVVKRN